MSPNSAISGACRMSAKVRTLSEEDTESESEEDTDSESESSAGGMESSEGLGIRLHNALFI